MSLETLRNAVPGARSCHFLDYAATALLPEPSAEAMAAIVRQGCEPMGRHFPAWLARLESVRRQVADTIGASPEEIALVTNTSTALSLVAAAVRWRPGDRVLYPADEFPSNRYVWQNLEGLGVEAKAVPPERGRSFAEQLAERDLERVRLVAFSSVAYRDGRRTEVADVVRVCRPQGILVAVDAIQAVGATPVDVHADGCDFLACGGQKWLLGPVGSGFLHIAAARLDELHAPLVGWASSRDAGDFEATRLELAAGARRLEPGLPDIAAVAGLGRSLELLAQTGWEEIFTRIAELRERLRREVSALGLSSLHDGAPETRSGIVTFTLPQGVDAERLESALEARDLVVTLRRRHLRVAPHAVTVSDDIDVLLEVLADQCGTRPLVVGRQTAGATGLRAGRLEASREGAPASAGRARETRRRKGRTSTATAFRRALVTGASRGLGEAIAEELAGRGCSLLLVARDAPRLEAVAARLASEHGGAVDAAPLDLADPRAVSAWIGAHQERLSSCDLVVNAAAWAEAGAFRQTDLDLWRTMLEANALAPAALVRAVLDGMLERGQGGILNVVTSGARDALPLFAGYAASKGALWAWSEALARELDGTGVRVTTFLPRHMPTATRQRLGRTALAHYALGERDARAVPARAVAAAAVRALERGRHTVVPWRARWTLAFNALVPELVTRRVRRVWRGA
jgi:selenocysteine lyase/cysteine desulfurase/short-subunit dehydrogenase